MIEASKKTGIILFFCSLIIAFLASKEFLKMREKEPIVSGDSVVEIQHLSDYLPKLKGTSGDSEIYVLKGEEDGGKVLVLGGTHGNEPSGIMSAILMIENAVVTKGTIYVIPRTNGSGLTHNDPQEGSPQRFTFTTKTGNTRWFRYGSRATNPLDQWPDPDVYIHAKSGQQLSGNETRNINRAYPGKPDGNFTEQEAYAITELIKENKIDMTIDLHEASPEYPVINAIVSHERAMDISSQVMMDLAMENISMALEPSPTNLHGLTHRELGDWTATEDGWPGTYAVLMESANPAQGRLRGKTDVNLVLTGKDKAYVKAQKLGRLYVPFDDNGHPLEERVGRHLSGVRAFINAMSEQEPDKAISFSNIPTFEELLANGIGNYLRDI